MKIQKTTVKGHIFSLIKEFKWFGNERTVLQYDLDGDGEPIVSVFEDEVKSEKDLQKIILTRVYEVKT